MDLLRIAARIASSSLYHVTWHRALSGIAEDGLQPGSGGIGVGAYAGHSRGKVFLAGPGSVRHWFARLEEHAESRSDDVLADGYVPVVLRVPEPDEVQDDEVAQSETISAEESYFVEHGVDPEDVEVWDGSSWIPVSDWESLDPSQAVTTEVDEESGDELHWFVDASSNPLLPPV